MRQEKQESLTTNYNLADTVYAKAHIECNGKVCLWLGVRTCHHHHSLDDHSHGLRLTVCCVVADDRRM